MPYRRQNLLSVLDFVSPPPPSPPPKTIHDSSSSMNPTTSLLIIGLILAVVIVVSASLHCLLRFIDRFNHHRNRSSSSNVGSEDHQQHIDSPIMRNVTPQQQNLIDSLPLFTSSAVRGLQKSGDCAVCISRFEPHDQLRLLPNCCHAFHSRCIDTWLASNRTCPLCRSSIIVEEALAPLGVSELESAKSSSIGGESLRLEIGSVSRRRGSSEIGGSRRSYSLGSFDYIVDDESEFVVVGPIEGQHRRGPSVCEGLEIGNDDPAPAPPGADVAEAAGGRGWLREYVDRIASSSSSSRAQSFRWSGRFAGIGSNRWSAGSWDLDGHAVGEETGMSQFFRWLAGK